MTKTEQAVSLYHEGKHVKEIAEILDSTRGSVKSMLYSRKAYVGPQAEAVRAKRKYTKRKSTSRNWAVELFALMNSEEKMKAFEMVIGKI